MMNKLRLLLVGRSKETLQKQSAALRGQADISLATRLVSNGHIDPLHGIVEMPEVLVLNLSPHAEEELKSLALRASDRRPVTLVIGPGDDPKLMRMAMQAGARDFIIESVGTEELIAAVQRVRKEKQTRESSLNRRLTAVINAKGGSGATLLACNLAHILTVCFQKRVALLDLDFQFGSSALSLDLKPEHTIIEALNLIDELDLVALEAYMTKHKSGLHLLASSAKEIVLPGEVPVNALQRLVQLVNQSYEQVFVDLPRQIDPLSTMVLEQADQIALVIQQSLAHVRDAKRLLNIMKGDLEIPEQRITVIINRYDAKNRLQLSDLEQTLNHRSFAQVPNDYERVAAATDLGIPLYDYARKAGITKALTKLAEQLGGQALMPPKKGLFQRMFNVMGA